MNILKLRKIIKYLNEINLDIVTQIHYLLKCNLTSFQNTSFKWIIINYLLQSNKCIKLSKQLIHFLIAKNWFYRIHSEPLPHSQVWDKGIF